MKYVYVIGEAYEQISLGRETPINHVVWFKTEAAAVDYISKRHEKALDPLHFVRELNGGIIKEYACQSRQDNVIVSYWWYITQLAPATTVPAAPPQDDNRCHCGTAARIVENGITCELCGKDMF